MRCSRYREALSARLDGEDPGLPDARVDAHLAQCAACQSWVGAAGAATAQISNGPDQPLTAAQLNALFDSAAAPRRSRLTIGHWRVGLAALAVMQLVVAWPGALLDAGHAPAHAAHELTAWDLGLAVGLLALAWMPSRVWGALPVVAVLVAFLAGASVADLAAGHAEFDREAAHTLQLAGLACLWALARRVPRTPVVLRFTLA